MNTFTPPPLFDWTLMRSFIAVLDEGSLQAAAKKLHTSQPTVGRHIALLEQQLSRRLFDRRGRNLLPTPLALGIAKYGREMEASANAIGGALREQDTHGVSRVRISLSQCMAHYLFPPVMAEIKKNYPHLHFEIVASNFVSNLQRGEADIALRMFRPQEENLVTRYVGTVFMGFYAHKSYIQGRGMPLNQEDLKRHDVIGFDQNTALIRGLQALGVNADPNMFTIRTDDHMMGWHAALHGLGLHLMLDMIAVHHVDMVKVLPDMEIPPMDLWLTVHQDVYACPGIREIYADLAKHFIPLFQPQNVPAIA